jgi:hypothetical protein
MIIAVVSLVFLVVAIATFFAADGPNRLAAAIAPTPTWTLTSTPSRTPTATPVPTSTTTPTFTPLPPPDSYPAIFRLETAVGYYASHELRSSEIKGSWSSPFYICAQYLDSDIKPYSFLIAVEPQDCMTGKTLGWVNASHVRFLFEGQFPKALTTPGP